MDEVKNRKQRETARKQQVGCGKFSVKMEKQEENRVKAIGKPKRQVETKFLREREEAKQLSLEHTQSTSVLSTCLNQGKLGGESMVMLTLFVLPPCDYLGENSPRHQTKKHDHARNTKTMLTSEHDHVCPMFPGMFQNF